MKNGLGKNEISQQGRYEITKKCPKGNNETCGAALIELNTDNRGYPILPGPNSDPTKDGLEYQKRLLRSFLTNHYSKCIHCRHRWYCVLMLARVCMWSAG